MKTRRLLLLAFLCLSSNAFAAAALVYAPTKEGVAYYFVGGQPSVAKARAMALRDCQKAGGHGKCRIVASDDGPLYWAVFHASDGSAGYGKAPNRQDAIDRAHAECVNGASCPIEAAHVWFDEGQRQEVAVAPPSSSNCRPPTGGVLRSTTYCDNGDCVRRFENGCSIRFQAAYCYDPLEQKFAWKPDGC